MSTPSWNSKDDAALDAAIRSRQPTGNAAVDALNAAVPQPDNSRRIALEQRLIDQLSAGNTPERTRSMQAARPYHHPLTGKRRTLRLSASLILTLAVVALCIAAVMFANLTPPDNSSNVAAPVQQDVSVTPSVPPASITPPVFVTSTPIQQAETTALPPPVVMPSSTPVIIVITSTPIASPMPTVDIVVALYKIERGDIITADDVGYRTWPESYLPLSAITDIGQVIGKVARSDIERESPIKTSDIAMPTIVPPVVWIPGDSNISDPTSSGLIVSIPPERLLPRLSGDTVINPQSRINLYAAVSVTSDDSVSPMIEHAPVAFAARVVGVSEFGTVMVHVPMEQGIVLTWLLNDTHALLYYYDAP